MGLRRIIQEVFLYLQLDFPWEIRNSRNYYDHEIMGSIEYSDFVEWIE